MKVKTTYYIEYGNGKSAWLSPNRSPNDFNDVTYQEERPVLFAEEGMTLKYQDEIVGPSVWLKDTISSDYAEVEEERPEPPIPNEENSDK